MNFLGKEDFHAEMLTQSHLIEEMQEVDIDFLHTLYRAFVERRTARNSCYSDATNLIYQEKLQTVEQHKGVSKSKSRTDIACLHYYYEGLKHLGYRSMYDDFSRRLMGAHHACLGQSPFENIITSITRSSSGNYLVQSNLYNEVWLPLVSDPLQGLDTTKIKHTELVIEEISQFREHIRDTYSFPWEFSTSVVHFTEYKRLPEKLKGGQI